MGIPTVVASVLLLYTFSSPAEGTAFGCRGQATDSERELIVKIHNEYRSKLTKGVTIKNTKLPAAKNMYEVKYDCDLEDKAEDAMNMTCKYAVRRKYKTFGHSRGDWSACPKYQQSAEEVGIPVLLEWWWSEGEAFDTVERRYSNFRAENFMNIAYGKNTKIGCAVRKAGRKLDIYCIYDMPLREGGLIYEAGNGCKKDSDCTTYGNSKCLPSGLCHGVPEPGYKEKSEALETKCGNETETGMTDEIRNYLLDIHNKFRSSVAKGLEPDALGDFTPKAKEMRKLGYDCYLERVALRTITCPSEHSDQKLFFWNMHNVSDSSMSNMDAAKEAVTSWINEIRHNGLGPSNVFAEPLYWRQSLPFLGFYVPIEHYVQMVIDTNDRMGCVIQDCKGGKYVHCFYGFRKSEPMGHEIYKMGNPCTKNSQCTGNVECLVEEGLCTAP